MHTEHARSLALEASELMLRLHRISDELASGFDAHSLAEAAMDDLEMVVDVDRAALYSAYEGTRPVVLAVRGAERSPWPDPDVEESFLHPGWALEQPRLAEADVAGTERVILTHPLVNGGRHQIGFLVADRAADRPFQPSDVDAFAAVATNYSPFIDTAMLFSWLRTRSGAEERSRAANQIHNGIAQEVVALGFQIDTLRLGAPGKDPDTRAMLDGLRGVVTRMVADLRARIADLKLDTRPETSVGALLVDRLQVVGAYTGLAVRLNLSESGTRLPANVEALVYRLALDVIGDATSARDATTLELELDAGQAGVRLVVGHDGVTTRLRSDLFDQHPLIGRGADLVYVPPSGGNGPRLTLRWSPDGPVDPADAADHSTDHSTGPAAAPGEAARS